MGIISKGLEVTKSREQGEAPGRWDLLVRGPPRHLAQLAKPADYAPLPLISQTSAEERPLHQTLRSKWKSRRGDGILYLSPFMIGRPQRPSVKTTTITRTIIGPKTLPLSRMNMTLIWGVRESKYGMPKSL